MINDQGVSAGARRPDMGELAIALAAGFGMTIAALLFCAGAFSSSVGGTRDSVCYWATGQLLVHRANPYDYGAIERLERAAGRLRIDVLIMRNPPWALPLVLPLGFLGLRVGVILWSLLLFACLLVSIALIRRIHGSPPNSIHWLGLAFTPALACFILGQTTLFALLGLCLFLRYHQSRPFAAGLALWLCMLKPHLFLPFGAALIAWIVFTRAWKVLAGAVTALAATSAIATLIAPHAWADYTHLMRSPAIEDLFIPCFGDLIRYYFWPQVPWTRYLLAAAACLWAAAYFWRRRKRWDWVRDGGFLMMISILCAPYCYIYDQTLAIPALMYAAYATSRRYLMVVLALLIVGVGIEGIHIFSNFLWAAPAWLIWYLWAMRRQGSEGTCNSPVAADSVMGGRKL